MSQNSLDMVNFSWNLDSPLDDGSKLPKMNLIAASKLP